MLRLFLGMLVWKKLITLKQAEKMDSVLGDKQVPDSIKEIVKLFEITK